MAAGMDQGGALGAIDAQLAPKKRLPGVGGGTRVHASRHRPRQACGRRRSTQHGRSAHGPGCLRCAACTCCARCACCACRARVCLAARGAAPPGAGMPAARGGWPWDGDSGWALAGLRVGGRGPARNGVVGARDEMQLSVNSQLPLGPGHQAPARALACWCECCAHTLCAPNDTPFLLGGAGRCWEPAALPLSAPLPPRCRPAGAGRVLGGGRRHCSRGPHPGCGGIRRARHGVRGRGGGRQLRWAAVHREPAPPLGLVRSGSPGT